ncbi:MAG: DUF3891 family protein [Chitinophagaceae bacterium]|nr:DUF3891 family protein [Chitinophagaceae bacterium]
MIVSSHQKGWKIITQRSHGLLAAMIAHQYDIDLPDEIMIPALIAIAEHDDGVHETLASQNLTDADAPRNFTVDDGNSKTDITPMLSLMEIASSKSQLNGLLASLHVKFLYDGDKRKTDQRLDNFLKDQEEYRTSVLKNLNISKKYANHLYRLLEWSDAFSLLICLDKIQAKERKMEISQSPDGDMNTVHYKINKDICVEPWPFKSISFEVFYEFKILDQLQFKSIQIFNEVYKDAKIQREVITFSQ